MRLDGERQESKCTWNMSWLVTAARLQWRQWLAVATPLLLLLVPLTLTAASAEGEAGGGGGVSEREAWCSYCVLVTLVFWLTQPMPLPAAALLPLVLLPLTGVQSTARVAASYMTSANALFLAGLMVAASVERCGLHERLALRLLAAAGDGVHRLLAAFMMAAMLLSMWISNTAATAIMTPIIGHVVTVLEQHAPHQQQQQQQDDNDDALIQLQQTDHSVRCSATDDAAVVTVTHTQDVTPSSSQDDGDGRKQSTAVVATAFYIGVAYAANCGGTGTLTGTAPNLVLLGELERLYSEHAPHQSTPLTYASFMAFSVPVMLTCTALGWLWLTLLFFGRRQLTDGWRCRRRASPGAVQTALRQRYQRLGPMTSAQRCVGVLFGVLVLLWLLRRPRFMPGWQQLLSTSGNNVSDATPAMLIVLIMFLVPTQPTSLLPQHRHTEPHGHSDTLLDWHTVQTRVQWGVLVLLGGGFALADAARQSGLAERLGGWLTPVLTRWSPASALLLVCTCTALATEVASNTATASVLMPAVAAAARHAQLHPVYVMLPVAVTTSYAFMLPVATPPNAIVHQLGHVRMRDMARAGAVMNVLCVLTLNAYINTLGVVVFDLKTTPHWITSDNNVTTITTAASV